MTQSSPSSTAWVLMFFASDEGSAGSVIAYRSNFTVQQWLEPLFFLLGRWDAQAPPCCPCQAHRSSAPRRQRHLAQFRGNVGVIQIAQPFTGFRVGQKEIPQTRFFGFILLRLPAVRVLDASSNGRPCHYSGRKTRQWVPRFLRYDVVLSINGCASADRSKFKQIAVQTYGITHVFSKFKAFSFCTC